MDPKLYEDTKGGRPGEWMQTFTGLQFFPEDPQPEDICIEDIAHALAYICRYAGHTTQHYSVAQHSVIMARYAIMTMRWPPELCQAVLLHDASEAYVCDLPHAVKRAVGAAYKDIENAIQDVIWNKYQLTGVASLWRKQIKELDTRILPLEKAAFMAKRLSWAVDQIEPLEGVTLKKGIAPERAERIFLIWWEQLTKERAMQETEDNIQERRGR